MERQVGHGGRADPDWPDPDRRAARDRAVAAACDRLAVSSPQSRAAVAEAYEATREHLAPVVVKAVHQMLADLRAEVARNPQARIVFVGRDGHSLAAAARQLEPAFFERHCEEVVLSRRLVENAVRDLERQAGRAFPQVEDFRVAGERTDAELEAKQQLTEYLQANRIPAGRPGSQVILVDSSYKGTVQELLSAVYPQTSFQGKYLFFGASPHDPHPGTKQGYVVHRETGDGRPLRELPDRFEDTFANQDALATIEDTLHGTLSSPRQIAAGQPAQLPLRQDAELLRGLNPALVAEPYTDPAVREAVLEVNLRAVGDYAAEVGAARAAGQPTADRVAAAADRGTHEVRAWVAGQPADRRLATMLDSFARRSDKHQLSRLADQLREQGATEQQARQVWETVAGLDSARARREFVAAFLEPPPGSRTGELTGRLTAASEQVRAAEQQLAKAADRRAVPRPRSSDPAVPELDLTDQPVDRQRRAGPPGPTRGR